MISVDIFKNNEYVCVFLTGHAMKNLNSHYVGFACFNFNNSHNYNNNYNENRYNLIKFILN